MSKIAEYTGLVEGVNRIALPRSSKVLGVFVARAGAEGTLGLLALTPSAVLPNDVQERRIWITRTGGELPDGVAVTYLGSGTVVLGLQVILHAFDIGQQEEGT